MKEQIFYTEDMPSLINFNDNTLNIFKNLKDLKNIKFEVNPEFEIDIHIEGCNINSLETNIILKGNLTKKILYKKVRYFWYLFSAC